MSVTTAFFVTESWLSPNISNGLLDPRSKFTIMQNDRSSGKDGGVCVFVHKSHTVAQVEFAGIYSELEIVVFDRCVTHCQSVYCVRTDHRTTI